MFAKVEKSSQKLLSDHMPFEVIAGETKLLAWNMLCSMKFNNQEGYFNSGFACDRDNPETNEQYHARISHVAAQLGTAHRTERPSFICLQECPEDEASHELFIAQTLKYLPSYAYERFIDSEKDYFLITFYDQAECQLLADLTQEVKAIKLAEGLNDRILPLVFKKKSDEKLLVVNVHASFGKDVKNDLEILNTWAKERKINMVLLGDFNRDLVKKSDDFSNHDISDALNESKQILDGLHVRAIESSSFISQPVFEKTISGEKARDADNRLIINNINTLIETRDGCISSQEATVRCLVNLNRPSIYLDASQLSGDLTKIPEGFIDFLKPDVSHAASSTSTFSL